MNITAPPIVTRARHGQSLGLNRRRNYRARYWTPWHTAAACLGIASVGIITAILAAR